MEKLPRPVCISEKGNLDYGEAGMIGSLWESIDTAILDNGKPVVRRGRKAMGS
jgi:hypothetical protein